MSTKGTWTRSTDAGPETRLALWIRFDNKSMRVAQDAATALEKVIEEIRNEQYDGEIFAANGDVVGAWDIEAFQS